MSIKSGRLRHTITIQDFTLTTGASGAQTRTYTNRADATNIPAAARQISASEAQRLGQMAAKTLYEFVLRKPAAPVMARQRIVMGGSNYEISSVTAASLNGDYIRILAEAQT